jgi:hypothetical protein
MVAVTGTVVNVDGSAPFSAVADVTGTDPWAALDGRLNAPAGPPQQPALLNGLAKRPPWKVAGVDYAVGYPSGTVLKAPTTIAMPGVTVNSSSHIVTVSAANTTLDGYDFSLNGGWQVLTQTSGTRIVNCKFVTGSNDLMNIVGGDSATNLYVGYCVIDGQGHNSGWGALINWNGSGLTIEYSWLHNAGGDVIQASSGGNLTFRYNLMQQAGQAAGAHGDILQTIGGDPYSATIIFNVTSQTSGFTQGFMLEPDIGATLGKITTAEYGYNTMKSSGSVQFYFTGVTLADIINTVTWHDNYFAGGGLAPGGVRSGPGDGSAKTIFINNFDMATGLPGGNG